MASESVCLVADKEFWRDCSHHFPTIFYNALLYIPLFTVWRMFFEYCIDDQAIKFAEREKLKASNSTSFQMNKQKYKESVWKGVTNAVLMLYGCYVLLDYRPFRDPSLLFAKWPQDMNTTELIYYRMAIGYHGHRAIYGLFYEKKRKDYYAVMYKYTICVIVCMNNCK